MDVVPGERCARDVEAFHANAFEITVTLSPSPSPLTGFALLNADFPRAPDQAAKSSSVPARAQLGSERGSSTPKSSCSTAPGGALRLHGRRENKVPQHCVDFKKWLNCIIQVHKPARAEKRKDAETMILHLQVSVTLIKDLRHQRTLIII